MASGGGSQFGNYNRITLDNYPLSINLYEPFTFSGGEQTTTTSACNEYYLYIDNVLVDSQDASGRAFEFTYTLTDLLYVGNRVNIQITGDGSNLVDWPDINIKVNTPNISEGLYYGYLSLKNILENYKLDTSECTGYTSLITLMEAL